MNDYQDFDFLDFDNYDSSDSVSNSNESSGNNSNWWTTFTSGASDVIDSVGGMNTQVNTDVKMDKKQLMYIGGGLLALVLILKKK
jgi:hypothetical protein